MNTSTTALAAGTLLLIATLLTLNKTVARNRPKMSLRLKKFTAALIVTSLAASVVTAPQFYLTRRPLLAYMAAPAIIGLVWTLYRIEAASPGRITSRISGGGNRRTRRASDRRQAHIVPRFLPALRGWLTLAIFEDKPLWRVAHIGSIVAAWFAAAFLPVPPGWVAPWLIILVTATRWMKVQNLRNRTITRIYAIAASHLDYSKAVNSRLTGGGAQFASPAGCISVEWADLTRPIRIAVAFPVTFAKTDLTKRHTFQDEFDASLPGAGWKFDWDTSGTTITITVATYPEVVRWELRTPDGWSTFYVGDELDDGMNVTIDVQSESPHMLVAGETGSGKPLPLSTRVPTPDGWRAFGDIHPGDQVFGPDGKPVDVVFETAPELFDEYEIVFSDGATVLAAEGHLWHTSTQDERDASAAARSGTAPDLLRPRLARDVIQRLRDDAAKAGDADAVTALDAAMLAGVSEGASWFTDVLRGLPVIGEVQETRNFHGQNGEMPPVHLPAGSGEVALRPELDRWSSTASLYPKADLFVALAEAGEQLTTVRWDEVVEGAVRTTRQILHTLRTPSGHANHSIPVAAALQLPEVELPVPPYELGAQLGLYARASASAYPLDSQIDDAGATDDGPPPSSRAAELAHSAIPEVYLRASAGQRHSLLAGLLDTNGCVTPQGYVQFQSSSQALARGTHELALTLGYRATLTHEPCSPGSSAERTWTVVLAATGETLQLNEQTIEQQEHTQQTDANAEEERRYIVDVRPTGRRSLMKCIQVNSADHLYLVTEHFIPTHNTEAMFVIAAQALLKGWEVAICDPKLTGWSMWSRRRRPTNVAGPDTGAERLRDGDGRPGVIEHAVELYGIRDVLLRCLEEMQRRKRINGAHKVVKWTELPPAVREAENIKPLLVVIDEALSLFDVKKGGTDEIKEENQIRGETLGAMQTLIIEARALGIHVLLGIQRPDAAVLGGALRSNLGARIACGVMEPSGYGMMFQTTGSVPRLVINNASGEKVIGRALVRSSPGQPIVPVQVAWIGPRQKDLDDVAPMPDEPEKEDETPSGAFNPYVAFDDPTPWLQANFSGPSTPPWESSPEPDESQSAFDAIDQLMSAAPGQGTGGAPISWENMPPEPPPWEQSSEPRAVDRPTPDVSNPLPGKRITVPSAAQAILTGEGDAWLTATPAWTTSSTEEEPQSDTVPEPVTPEVDELAALDDAGWFSNFITGPSAPSATNSPVSTPQPSPPTDESDSSDDDWW